MVVYNKLRVSKKAQTQACNKGQTLPQVCLRHLENQGIRGGNVRQMKCELCSAVYRVCSKHFLSR